MFSDARRHMMYRIANAPVLAYPFPHMVATDVLPPGLFRHALAMLPGDEAYTGFGTAGRRTLQVERGVSLMPADPSREFWNDMLAALTGQTIDAVLVAAPLRGRRREQIGTPLHPAYRDEEKQARARGLPPLVVRDVISRLRPHLHDAARLGAAIGDLIAGRTKTLADEMARLDGTPPPRGPALRGRIRSMRLRRPR